MQKMTPEEKFQFDLEGYLVIPGALSPQEVVELNELADQAWPGEHDETGLRRTSNVAQWGPRFRDLMDHPNIVEIIDVGEYIICYNNIVTNMTIMCDM